MNAARYLITAILVALGTTAFAQDVASPATGAGAPLGKRPVITLPVLPAPTVAGEAVKQAIIPITDGSNKAIYVGLGLPNRIDTPFAEPRMVQTTATKFTAVGRALYFIPASEAPIAGFVINADGKGGAANVTLIPTRGMPGQNILLALEKRADGSEAGIRDEVPMAPPSDYTDGLKELLRTFIQGNVPPGFSVGTLNVGMVRVGSVAVVPEKLFEGAAGHVYRYRVENVGREPLELNEASFGEPGVRAVTFWPRARIAPGETTMVWIVVSRGDPS